MDKLNLSVIIPTLDEEKYLPKLLSDLSNQTDKDFEVIVADADSSDKTKQIAQSYQNKLNLQFCNFKIKNVSKQRNLGSKRAKGNYLFFIDADMRISRGFIKKIKKNIIKTRYLVYLFKLSPDRGQIHDRIAFNLINNLLEISQFTPKPFAPGGNMVFQRDFFFFLGGFNEKATISEDHDIVQRAKQRGVTAKFLIDVSAKFSMRRFQYEGRFKIFIKYAVASLYNLRSGKIEKHLFDYQMGGARYNQINAKKKKMLMNFDEYITKLKKYLAQISKNNLH